MKKTIIYILLLALTGCATMNTHSPQNTTQTRDFKLEAETVYSTALQTAMELNWEITMSDSGAMAFSAKAPCTLKRWDDQINVFVTNKEGLSTLTVKSALGHKPNAEYINSYLDQLTEKIK